MDGDNGVISQLLQWIELMLEPCNPFDHLRSPAVKEQRLGRNTTVAGRSAYYQACCLAATRTSDGRRFSEFISITRRQVMNPDSSTEEDSDEDSSSSDNIANQQTHEPNRSIPIAVLDKTNKVPVCTNLEKHYYPWTILHWWWWTTFLRRGMCGFGSSFLPYFVTFCYAFPTIVLQQQQRWRWWCGPSTYFLLRDALATCDQIHYTKVIEYIQNVPLTEVWIERETSCIKLQCNTAYTTGLWLQWVGIGYDYTTSRRVAGKKMNLVAFRKNIRFFANFIIWKEQRAQEPESLESNNKVSYFCKNISYCIP